MNPVLSTLKRALCTATLLMATLSLQAAKPPEDIQRILDQRLSGKYDLILDGLEKSPVTPEQSQRLKNRKSYYRYNVPTPPGLADSFHYFICRFHDSGEIWIFRSGGVAGVFELYTEKKK